MCCVICVFSFFFFYFVLYFCFFFFKQKPAYEIYQCDWSSDVCSSDLDNRDKKPLLFLGDLLEEIAYALIRLRVLARLADDIRVNQIHVCFRAHPLAARNPHPAPRWAWP